MCEPPTHRDAFDEGRAVMLTTTINVALAPLKIVSTNSSSEEMAVNFSIMIDLAIIIVSHRILRMLI